LIGKICGKSFVLDWFGLCGENNLWHFSDNFSTDPLVCSEGKTAEWKMTPQQPHNHILYLSSNTTYAITGFEGQSIDNKIDDGLAVSGMIGGGEAGEWNGANQTISRTLFVNTGF
jgi:hypothetical protein